ncbi:hypothetical protein [Agrobacterium larrymoorei]|uniref:Uncharacterized protein n=1 Tax=Agrobacterium larrymoorei TaxID=160699 RepID=A0A4D7DR13_9HYPH|nr:hypothetical protein [Agrobacterium larrymoorei]QCI98808.1 hypothetical protein CFBP5473_13425 [Agrobacterium larrymoorei]QYA08305.1 hypothetical protein J5285_06310 [Agrobacterium larrymoorei]
MFRTLPIEAFSQIDILTRPYIGKLPPVDSSLPSTGNDEARTARDNVKNLLYCEFDRGWPIDALFRLLKIAEAAFCAKKLHRDQLQILWELWETLRDSEYIIELAKTEQWSQAFDQILIHMQGSSFRRGVQVSDRQRFLGEALLKLAHKGFPFRIDGRGASLTKRSYKDVCNLIEKKIKRAGGEHAANALLGLMKKSGRIEDGTLLHARMPTTLYSKTRSGTPWHYIYSLALKHVASPTARNPEPVLEAMESLAVAMAATLDVEPHSSYENLSLSRMSFTGFMFETVIYDELFAIPQWQPKISEPLLTLWIDSLEAEGCEFPIASAADWKLLGKQILKCALEYRLSIADERILKAAQSSKEASRALLKAISSPASGVNQSYKTPSDTQHRSATNFPILRASYNRLLIQPRAVVGRAFVECIYSEMRKAQVPDLENIMGRALERLALKIFESAGMPVSVSGKKYRNAIRDEILEADLVFETGEKIFLVECTKKPLTNRARSGHTLDGLRDFSGSFLKLLQQLAQHEAHLRKVGMIEFEDGQVVRLGGRSVEKVALNLFDHGSLQNRDMTMSFIEALSNTYMTSSVPEAQKILTDVNKRLKFINQALNEIVSSYAPANERGLFDFAMSTWWLSVDQLHYLAFKEGNLWKTMERIRHMTARSGDIFYEVNRVMNINEVGKSIFDVCKKMNSRGVL